VGGDEVDLDFDLSTVTLIKKVFEALLSSRTGRITIATWLFILEALPFTGRSANEASLTSWTYRETFSTGLWV
jgi:hypothetical protein